MLKTRSRRQRSLSCTRHGGDTLMEVLVTLFILAIGLLGFIALQAKIHSVDAEAYARAQAILLLSDMTDRINARSGAISADPALAPGYAMADIGIGAAADCTAAAAGAARDLCEWGNALRGTAEAGSGGGSVGAMLGARGCIELLQVPDATAGVCTPAIFRVTVAWQGMTKTSIPAITCGQNQYGAEEYRRVVAARVVVGLPSCI